MTLLKLTDVCCSMGSRRILEGISLSAEAGEVLALVGPNGAGKSTLLSVIAGDIQPESGSVVIRGRAPQAWSALELARIRSVLLQNPQSSFAYRVGEIVAMGRTPWKGTPQAERDREAIESAMRATETLDFAERTITTLSGGESGRSQLARVLAQETPLVLLDEPTAALDILHQEKTLETCLDVATQGAAVVVVLHDLDAAAAYADRMVLMRRGSVVAAGTPREVCTSELLTEVYGWPIDVVEDPESGRPMVRPHRRSNRRRDSQPQESRVRGESGAG